MRDVIEFIGLGIGILGLIPLWFDKRRQLIAAALSVLVIVGAVFIFWERHDEHLEATARAATIETIEGQIVSAVCRSDDGMNFEQFLLVVDREYNWELVDEALGGVVHSNLLVVNVLVPSWTGKGQIPIRVWKVKNRAACAQL
jgi:hypothetical protein